MYADQRTRARQVFISDPLRIFEQSLLGVCPVNSTSDIDLGARPKFRPGRFLLSDGDETCAPGCRASGLFRLCENAPTRPVRTNAAPI